MREVMTEKTPPHPPRTTRGHHQRQCVKKKPSMPGKLSKEVPDMGPMQWPTGGGDGSEGGKKGAFLCVFLKGGFSTFETHHVSIHS